MRVWSPPVRREASGRFAAPVPETGGTARVVRIVAGIRQASQAIPMACQNLKMCLFGVLGDGFLGMLYARPHAHFQVLMCVPAPSSRALPRCRRRRAGSVSNPGVFGSGRRSAPCGHAPTHTCGPHGLRIPNLTPGIRACIHTIGDIRRRKRFPASDPETPGFETKRPKITCLYAYQYLPDVPCTHCLTPDVICPCR